jgi:hypothetical protein
MVLARTDKVIGCVRILLRCKSPDVCRVSDAGQRQRRDIHQWPASESRQGKNPRGMGAENAAHSAIGIWLMRKV